MYAVRQTTELVVLAAGDVPVVGAGLAPVQAVPTTNILGPSCTVMFTCWLIACKSIRRRDPVLDHCVLVTVIRSKTLS